jgi:hypothetical protein
MKKESDLSWPLLSYSTLTSKDIGLLIRVFEANTLVGNCRVVLRFTISRFYFEYPSISKAPVFTVRVTIAFWIGWLLLLLMLNLKSSIFPAVKNTVSSSVAGRVSKLGSLGDKTWDEFEEF